MATDTNAPRDAGSVGAPPISSAMAALRFVLKPIASLRLTVLLFSLAIFIILVGTLAQDKEGMWEVMSRYFRSWIMWVHVSVFFPTTWFPGWSEHAMRLVVGAGALACGLAAGLPFILSRERGFGSVLFGCFCVAIGFEASVMCVAKGGFYFAGGATIGTLMSVNLLSAYLVWFRLQARGWRLVIGLVVSLIGVLFTCLVIVSGHSLDGGQVEPILSWRTLWLICLILLTGVWTVMIGAAAVMYRLKKGKLLETRILMGAIVLLTVCLAWLWISRESAYLGDAGMRILWQLTKGAMVGVVLLVGCILLYRRRGGVVLIHFGLGLLMVGEWFVSWYAVEERLTIEEGETAIFAIDIRTTELAIVDPQFSDTHDDVVVVAEQLLIRNANSGLPIQHEWLPFDIQVVQYMRNSTIEPVEEGDKNPATAGLGRSYRAVEQPISSGADTRGRVDMASAYVRLLKKGSDEELGTYLVSQYMSSQDVAEQVEVGGKTYQLSLRFKRSYKPYTVKLTDVRKDDYIGTDTPRNYSSDIVLTDTATGTSRKVHIWMNNPLRYGGETFYQSGYHRDPVSGVETTTLQVVTNTGWMIPYISCMLVGVGMLAHFWFILIRYLKRQAGLWGDAANGIPLAEVVGGTAQPVKPKTKEPRSPMSLGSVFWPAEGILGAIVPIVVVGAIATWLFLEVRLSQPSPDEFDLPAFRKLPVVDGGRVKPIDTLARTTLRKLSDKESIRLANGREISAAEWLLMIVAKPIEAEKLPVFRIQNLEVLDTLGLKRRRFFRYSLAELRGEGDEVREELEEFERQAREARQLDMAETSFYQKKLLEIDNRFREYTLLASAFQPQPCPPFPTKEEFQKDREAANRRVMHILQLLQSAEQSKQMLDQMHAPLMVPRSPEELEELGQDSPQAPPEPWLPYATAVNRSYVQQQIDQEKVGKAVKSLQGIFAAYAANDPRAFNREVHDYLRWLAVHRPKEYSPGKVAVETYYNHASPLYYCIAMSLMAFLLTSVALLAWNSSLNRSAFWLLVLTVAFHTLGMLARMYISGRPPVTNLYSSAVFIGWASMLFGLSLEAIYRLGIGNMIASVAGFGALMIAQFLAMRGDTFTVMQAVLDTQFWLATHVVAITLGYAATFVAGLIGIGYIFAGMFTPVMNKELDNALARMIYAVVCFAIFFSFIGTVLGGLWADDSWGRFWGWDPKENGALIIVLWNAILLHASRSGMVKNRGFAVLAVGGNIVTSWSWFGVNELGVGLHSYGFTEGVLLTLGLFVLSQLVIIFAGGLPKELWWSFRRRDQMATSGGP